MALLGNLTGSAQYFNDDDFYAGIATTSLRFNSADDAYLTREFDAPSNNKKWTYSTWLKRSKLGAHQAIISSNVDGSNYFDFRFSDADILYVQNRVGASNLIAHGTTSKFRDTSAWYNIVLIYDSDNSTAANRTLVYVNGVKHTLAAVAGDGDASYFNVDGINHNFGASRTADGSGTVWSEFGGYVSEVNFCDGQAYAPTNFGETKNGVWIPKNTSGLTFGNNGFRIRHDQVGVGTASTSTIGADVSGNTNHLTSVNIVASDCAMPDSPENNFATLNPLKPATYATYSEGNLKLAHSTNGWAMSFGTFSVSSGKWYFENVISAGSNLNSAIGFALDTVVGTTSDGNTAGSYMYANDGNKYINGTGSTYGDAWGDGEVVACVLDLDNNTIQWYNENAGQGVISSIPAGSYSPFISIYYTDTRNVVNFGQDSSFSGKETAQGNTDGNGIGDFYYAPPSGFLALCTANLPEPTIGPNSDTQADDHFNTVLYTGNGQTGLAVSGVGFQPDFVWLKNRTGTAYYHQIYDSTRGATKALYTAVTNAEDTVSGLTAFDSDGFTVGNSATANNNGVSTVAWNWKANGGTTSSNTDGSITSTVQANTTAGFSVVTYTGNGTNGATIGTGLTFSGNVIIITRQRNEARGWYTTSGESSLSGKFIYLDTTAAAVTHAGGKTSSDFSSGTVELSNLNEENKNSGTYVSYCFHSVEGYSKIGSYTGNENADGSFVYVGFRPAFLLLKRTDEAHSWRMFDSKRSDYNTKGNYLTPDSTGGEGATLSLDFLSNGFKIRTNNDGINGVGSPHIYMAFAEAPFKYANAR